MKFREYKMCSLNESLFQTAVEACDNDDIDMVVAADPGYADTIEQSRRTHDVLEDRFKEFKAEAEDFVEDNQKREKEGQTTMEMKKMHLSEGLFEDVKVESPTVEEEEVVVKTTEPKSQSMTEAVDFGDPADMGRGACTPLAYDYRRGISEYVKHFGDCDPREEKIIHQGLARYAEGLKDNLQTIENFNTYWTTRYPLMVEFIKSQLDMIPVEKDLGEAVDAVEEPVKKRTRGENEKKERRDYSSEDLWLAVYDELSASTDNEGEGQQVDKQIKARRGERYENVYPHGDTDIIIYATKPEEFEFARRVADHYGVVAEEPKEDKNKSTNGFYKYSMVIRIPEDGLYSDED